MPFLLIPRQVKSTTAQIWVAIVNESGPVDPGSLTFRYNGTPFPIPAFWREYGSANGANHIVHQEFELTGLQPRTDYALELFHAGPRPTVSLVRTLPDDLPFLGDPGGPFKVLLASCFCSSRDESPAIGSNYFFLPFQEKPDIKILCGDQVYLDAPARDFILTRHDPDDLAKIHFKNYLDTWTQSGSIFGNSYFLQNGANFFSTDDHEFWNNAPDEATAVFDTHSPEGRNAWKETALELLDIFQGVRPASSTDRGTATSEFDVGPLKFFIADTRVNREPDQGIFMWPDNLTGLRDWIDRLNNAESEAVGVLVVGQPIFAKEAGWFFGSIFDKHLPDFEQYSEFIQILYATQRPLMVLTGDVHYGRLSMCWLPNGVPIYEVISSPTAVVAKLPLFGGWGKPPELFPASPVMGVSQKNTFVNDEYRLEDNHFMTLGFYRDGAGISVSIKAFKFEGNFPVPVEVDTFRIGNNINKI